MNDSKNLLNELKNIREIMERSNRFLSLSGLSGILIGIYALIGSFLAYRIIYIQIPSNNGGNYINDVLILLFIIGFLVLLFSFVTILFLTFKKARKEQIPIWGPGSKLLLINLLIPLITGGIFIATVTLQGYYGIISACFLIFYGLALVNAAKYTRPEIFSLGIIEIIIGLIAAVFTGFSLYLWAIGFGVVHIIYGFIYLHNETKNPIK